MPICLKTILLLIALACLALCAADRRRASPSLSATLRNFAVGNGMLQTLYSISFDPRAGEAARGYYQAAHGYRGQLLIDRAGKGYSRYQLRRFGIVD